METKTLFEKIQLMINKRRIEVESGNRIVPANKKHAIFYFIIFLIVSIIVVSGCVSQEQRNNTNLNIANNETPQGHLYSSKSDIPTNILSNTDAVFQQTQNKTISYQIIDNKTNCTLDGIAYPSIGDYYYPSLESKLVNGSTEISDIGSNHLYLNLTLSSCFGNYKGFHILRSVNITTNRVLYFDVRPQFPLQLNEYSNFIRPEQVTWWIDKNLWFINKSSTTEDRLKSILYLLSYDIPYIGDWSKGAWYPPNVSLHNPGDCKQISTTFLSLIKAYNNSLDCFNIAISPPTGTGHLTTLCIFNNPMQGYKTFYFYDQGDTHVTGNFYNAYTESERLGRLRNLLSSFFDTYGIETDTNVNNRYIAFNETDTYEFNGDESFIQWVLNA